ncbi:MAG: hypothetical protein PHU85_14425, partial [Phycisphaerae bacterium]|nr:hypothetical protein [Phycisphaerae bacterium]
PGRLNLIAVGSSFEHVGFENPVTLASAGRAEELGSTAVRLLRETTLGEVPVVTLKCSLEYPDATLCEPAE